MNRTIKNWAEIINEDSLTSNDVIDMLKDFYSVDMSYCIGTEIEESMQTIYDFIHSEKNRNLIARAFRCKPEEISTVSVSIGNMADLEKYKILCFSNLPIQTKSTLKQSVATFTFSNMTKLTFLQFHISAEESTLKIKKFAKNAREDLEKLLKTNMNLFKTKKDLKDRSFFCDFCTYFLLIFYL